MHSIFKDFNEFKKRRILVMVQFSEYFSFPRRGHIQPAPIITIAANSIYQISEFFLEEFYNVAPNFVCFFLKHFISITIVTLQNLLNNSILNVRNIAIWTMQIQVFQLICTKLLCF